MIEACANVIAWAVPSPVLAQALRHRQPWSVADVLDPYMLVFFVAFLLAITVTPIMRWLAIRSGIVDWPDLKRKSHIEPVAYLGGVALFTAWAGGVLMCLLITPHIAPQSIGPVPKYVSDLFTIGIGAAIIAITGLCDDVYGISPRVKIGGQILAAAALSRLDVGTTLVQSAGVALGFDLPTGLCYALGTALIALFVLGGCNAMNLIDGLDGLATGVSAIACIGFLFITVIVAVGLTNVSDQPLLTDIGRIIMGLALLGALLGFLPYNFNPASIFMGDAGSLLIGYLCATSILLFGDVPVLGPKLVMAALIIFAVPVSDTSLAIFRRLMRGQPIFSPDSQHMHHLLIRTGMSVRRAVMSLYGLAIFFAVLGGSLVFVPWRYVIAMFLVIFGFVLVTAYKIGHRQLLRQKLAVARHGGEATPVAGAPRPIRSNGEKGPAPSKPAEAGATLPSSTPSLPAGRSA